MCLKPKWIYKKGNRKYTTFRGQEGEFYEIGMYTNCGVCSQCIAGKSNNWVVRNYYESMEHKEKCFITLTYNEDNNPIILRKKDLQDFIKRLRYYLKKVDPQKKIRYYACGEYGTQHKRPHMHIILYGWKPKDLIYLDVSKRGNILMASNIVKKAWKWGRVTVQEFNQAEVPYISLYTTDRDENDLRTEIRIKRENLKKYYYKRLTRLKNGTDKKDDIVHTKAMIKDLEANTEAWQRVREFNTWSLSLGWKKFEEEYNRKNGNMVFEHYIGNYTIPTPTPWLKKLANKYGEVKAINELKRREENIEKDINKMMAKAISAKIKDTRKEILERQKEDSRGPTDL